MAALIGRQSRALDVLAVTYLSGRLGQSISHITPGAGRRFNVRFGFFVVQIVCLAGFIIILSLPA